jgi:hypothetical protein
MQLKLIGGGEHSSLYHYRGHILKAIQKPEECNQAEEEFAKQKDIYNCFALLRMRDYKNHRLLNQIKQYVVISEPIAHSAKPLIVNGVTYACSIEMSTLKGLPLSMIQSIDRQLSRHVTMGYWPKYQQQDIMLHLSFNNPTESRLLGVKTESLISETNPSRGYFFSRDDAEEWIDSLKVDYQFPLSITELEEMIGFIYGWIFYACRIIPLDIEITLGLYDGQFKLNVLDFGQTVRLNDANHKYSQWTTTQQQQQPEKLLEKVKQAINEDEYIDLVRDRAAMRGFSLAQEEFKRLTTLVCDQCGKEAHRIKLTTGQFYCSEECENK